MIVARCALFVACCLLFVVWRFACGVCCGHCWLLLIVVVVFVRFCCFVLVVRCLLLFDFVFFVLFVVH